MTKFVVRLSLVGLLLGAIVSPALAHSGNSAPQSQAATKPVIQAADLPALVADSNPIPWPPQNPGKPPVKAADLPALVADSNPIPWPPQNPGKPPAQAVV